MDHLPVMVCSSSKKGKNSFNSTLVSTLCFVTSCAEVCAAAAVVADLPRVRGETETIVGLGLN